MGPAGLGRIGGGKSHELGLCLEPDACYERNRDDDGDCEQRCDAKGDQRVTTRPKAQADTPPDESQRPHPGKDRRDEKVSSRMTWDDTSVLNDGRVLLRRSRREYAHDCES